MPKRERIEPRPNVPQNIADLPWEDDTEESVRFGHRSIPLGVHGGGRQMGFRLTELPPGKQSCPFHYHQREEEHFFVISGRCILRSGDDRHEMKAGDYVCFPPGTGIAHALLNPFSEPCRYVAASSPWFDPLEVAVYPDSGKAAVRGLKEMIPWPQDGLDHFHGEQADEPLPRED